MGCLGCREVGSRGPPPPAASHWQAAAAPLAAALRRGGPGGGAGELHRATGCPLLPSGLDAKLFLADAALASSGPLQVLPFLPYETCKRVGIGGQNMVMFPCTPAFRASVTSTNVSVLSLIAVKTAAARARQYLQGNHDGTCLSGGVAGLPVPGESIIGPKKGQFSPVDWSKPPTCGGCPCCRRPLRRHRRRAHLLVSPPCSPSGPSHAASSRAPS